MNKLFISYARQDEAFARQIATLLSEAGASIWIDVDNIPGGMKWSSAIQEGLDTGEGMIVVLSSSSLKSRNVEDEWHYYLDKNKPIFPLLIEKVELPYQLNRVQWIDFTDPKAQFLTSYRKLLTALKNSGFTLKDDIGTAPFQIKTSPTPAPIKPQAAAAPTLSENGLKRALSSPLWQGIGAIVGIIALVVAILALNPANNPSVTATSTPTNTAQTTSTDSTPPTAPSTSPSASPDSSAALSVGTEGTLDVSITYSNEESLTILVVADSDITGVAFKTTTKTIPVADYFEGLGLVGNQVKAAGCLRFVLAGETPPLPRACDTQNTFVVEISPSEVFWYDTVSNQPANLSLLRGDQSLGVCSAAVASATGCKFS